MWRCLPLVLLLSGCSIETLEPERPEGVPAGALWIGGVDGGVFIALEPAKDDPENFFQGVVFHEASGEVWFRGEFALDPPDSGEVVVDAEQIAGWDGERLLLSDGRSLVAKNPPE